MKIAQRLGSGKKRITPLWHGECSGMNRLTIKTHPVIEHSQHTVHHSDIVSVILKDRSLLYVGFKHIHVFFGRETIFFITLEAAFIKRLAEGRGIV